MTSIVLAGLKPPISMVYVYRSMVLVDSYGKLVGTYTSPMEAMGKMAIRNLHHFGWYESTILDVIDQKKGED